LYNYTLIFLAKINNNSSIREINRNLNNNIKVSLITMMEYLKYSIKAKIIKQIYSFDFKKDKEIATKSKYYFTCTNLRSSLHDFKLETDIIKENFLFNELDKSNYKINS
jgi:predicted AAA+ superfamily ATPase